MLFSTSHTDCHVILLALLLLSTNALAWPWSSDKKKNPEEQARIQDSLKREELKNLQREVDALTRIRLQKADSLEKLEAEHWRKRYAESELSEEHQVATRELDGRYSKLSTDLGRVNEEVLASKELTSDAEEKALSDENAYDAFRMQIKLSIDKTLGDVTGDYPLGMNDRLLRLKEAENAVEGKNPNALSAARIFLGDQLLRHEMTYSQSFENTISQVGSRPDVKVNRLRLGTVFLGEVALDNQNVQALIRSGALQGKVFEWNSNLPQEMASQIQKAVSEAGNSSVEVAVPIDVLQNKAVKNSITDTQELSLVEQAKAFFKKGGIVM